MDGMQNLLSDLILFRLPEGSLPQRLLSSDAAAPVSYTHLTLPTTERV